MIKRRRFLAIAAAAALAPAAAIASQAVRWHGRALGADAEMVIEHPDGALARNAIAEAVAEIERLEAIFSLHRPGSALARLNAEGRLEMPPLDLVRVLTESAAISEASGGAFDVTVQPLWQRYADALTATAHPPADLSAPVDWRQVPVSPDRIVFGRPGMAVTLNGIAQGYITDRVAELLRRHGFTNVLVDLGETRVLGPHADGQPWTLAVPDPMQTGATLRRLQLNEGAVATTEALGSSFADTGIFGHLLDPASGRPALAVPSVTIRAATATLADGLSTAIAVAGAGKAPAILARFPGTTALLSLPSGRQITL